MRRISEAVEEEVRRTAFLEGALADGLINYSALARRLRPRLERQLLRKVSVAAIGMALRRLEPRVARRTGPRPKGGAPELTVRSNLMEFTFRNSPTLRAKQRRLLARLANRPDAFVTYTQGVSEAMLIVSADLERAVEELFRGEARVATLRHLSAVILRLSPAIVRTPGAYYRILKQLAWENINIVDVVSTYTEFTIVLDDSQVGAAFAVLREARPVADTT
ncbi:MAG: aspartate kinase [Gemmatimonadales bacterium]|nr:aspartate kinase [Gemmatimonadales bacterium]